MPLFRNKDLQNTTYKYNENNSIVVWLYFKLDNTRLFILVPGARRFFLLRGLEPSDSRDEPFDGGMCMGQYWIAQ